MSARIVTVLALVVAVLWTLDRRLTRDAERALEPGDRVGRVVPAVSGAAAGLTLERDGEKFVYARSDGLWRCASFHRAVADRTLVEALWRALTEAEGVVVTREPGTVAGDGLEDSSRIRVTFHGPRMLEKVDRDVLFAVDLGRVEDDGQGCLARRVGSETVWQLETNPGASLAEDLERGRPPLLERFALDGSWPGTRQRWRRVQVIRRDAPAVELRLQNAEPSPEQVQAGRPAYEWRVRQDGVAVPAAAARTLSYTAFLRALRYRDILDASPAAPRLGALILTPEEGEPLELPVHQGPDGTTALFNPATGLWFTLDGIDADRLLPPAAAFQEADGPDPWSPADR